MQNKSISGINLREMCIEKILNEIERVKRSLELRYVREDAHMSIAVTASYLFIENNIGNDRNSRVLTIGSG